MSENLEMNCKACKACKEVKPLTDFHKEKKGKYGRRSRCKSCYNRSKTPNPTKIHQNLVLKPEQLQDDRWINVIGFPNYKVSKDGFIYNKLTDRYSRGSYDKTNGRYHVYLTGAEGSKWIANISRVMYFSFHGFPDDYDTVEYEIDHIDNNRTNDTLENLQCLSKQAHLKKSAEHHSILMSKKVSQYTLEGEFIQTFSSVKEAVRFLNEKSYSNIAMCARGETNKAYDYIWKYE